MTTEKTAAPEWVRLRNDGDTLGWHDVGVEDPAALAESEPNVAAYVRADVPVVDVRELEYELHQLETDAGPLRGRLVGLCAKARTHAEIHCGDALDVHPPPDSDLGAAVTRIAEALEAHDVLSTTYGAGLSRAPLWNRLARVGIATALASRWAGVLDDAERPANIDAERHARTKLVAEVARALAEAARDNADETDDDWTKLARTIVHEIEPEDRDDDAPAAVGTNDHTEGDRT